VCERRLTGCGGRARASGAGCGGRVAATGGGGLVVRGEATRHRTETLTWATRPQRWK
jgi:hypothetical protein